MHRGEMPKLGSRCFRAVLSAIAIALLCEPGAPGVKRKYVFTNIPTYEPDAPLRVSGLLGPVRLEQVSAGPGER